MTGAPPRLTLKRWLGDLPFAPELLQRLRGGEGPPAFGYRVDRLSGALPGWVDAAAIARNRSGTDDHKRILVFGYLRWWLEYAVALSLLLTAEGHRVDLAYLPYRDWTQPLDRFDLRRLRFYLRRHLQILHPLVRIHDLSNDASDSLPPDQLRSIDELSRIDVQYSRLREEVHVQAGGEDEALFLLRRARNRTAARAVLDLLQKERFDVVVIPNGSILEFGAVYRTSMALGVGAVTYEFGEQRERIWLAQNDEVMKQDTSAIWQLRGDQPLSAGQDAALDALLEARRGARTWGNFGRRWQTVESQGAQAARHALQLDPERPLALLCTNVVGDSLALGRQLFTEGMADWLAKTARFFAARPEAQLVVRVHPGELKGAGHPSTEIVSAVLPQLPDHVRVVPPDSKINTYDLIELADLGLVYTSTVGLEMALAGVPVIVAGRTHYRGKGMTNDPDSLEAYFEQIDRLLDMPPAQDEIESRIAVARRYAYRFFFEYALPFPWHIVYFWEDQEATPFADVVADAGRRHYHATLQALHGEPIRWAPVPQAMGVSA